MADIDSTSHSSAGFSLRWVPARIRAVFAHPLFSTLVESRSLARLREISFLGAIDYALARGAIKEYQSRFSHTLGVAHLALYYAHIEHLEDWQRDELVAAALLHDIGHGPLSHTLEPYFSEEFGIDHHVVTKSIIFGRLPFAKEIYDILRRHHVMPERVVMLINGELHEESYNAAFAHPINIDTVEAITRAHHIANKKFRSRPLQELVRARLAEKHSELDDFWLLKSDVYKKIIDSKIGRYADETILGIARQNHFDAPDFYLTEPQFFKKHPTVLHELHAVRSSVESQHVDYKRTRSFWIDTNVSVRSPERYARSRKD